MKWIHKLKKTIFKNPFKKGLMEGSFEELKTHFATHSLFPSLIFVNLCQITAVFTANLLKLLLIFFLIDLQKDVSTPQILATVGVVYVLPFLLFSSVAGKFADRFSKKKISVLSKSAEVIILLLGCFSFFLKNAYLGYAVLFLLSTNCALYGPAKYGILKDLFSSEKIATASSTVTSFTYIGIILGTFFASFLTEFTNRNYPLSILIGAFFSLLGLIASWFIPKTASRATSEELGFEEKSWKKAFRLWREAKDLPYLQMSILLGSFFLFIGAFVQLNIIPFAMQEMNLNDVFGGYLFLGCAVGIAMGALTTGQILKKQAEIGISSIAGILLSFMLLLISFSGKATFWVVFGELVILGFFGGCFVVPCETHLQLTSPDSKRGGYIGLLNTLSFVGVLFAALAIALFGALGLKAKGSFILLAAIVFSILLPLFKKQTWSLFRLISALFPNRPLNPKDPSTWLLSIDPLPTEIQELKDFKPGFMQRGVKAVVSMVPEEVREEIHLEKKESEAKRGLLWVFLPPISEKKSVSPTKVIKAIAPLVENNPPLFVPKMGPFFKPYSRLGLQFAFLRFFCGGSKKYLLKQWKKRHLAIVISEENERKEERFLEEFAQGISENENKNPLENLEKNTPFYFLHWEIETLPKAKEPLSSPESSSGNPQKRPYAWKGRWIKVKSLS